MLQLISLDKELTGELLLRHPEKLSVSSVVGQLKGRRDLQHWYLGLLFDRSPEMYGAQEYAPFHALQVRDTTERNETEEQLCFFLVSSRWMSRWMGCEQGRAWACVRAAIYREGTSSACLFVKKEGPQQKKKKNGFFFFFSHRSKTTSPLRHTQRHGSGAIISVLLTIFYSKKRESEVGLGETHAVRRPRSIKYPGLQSFGFRVRRSNEISMD